MAVQAATIARPRAGSVLTVWTPEDRAFWQREGSAIANLNLLISIPALLAACFSLPGGVLRAIGGWLSDKYGAHPVTWWVMLLSFVCLFFLSYPQTDLVVHTTRGDLTMHFGLDVWLFTTVMFLMGISWAVGKASVFKYISDQYTDNIGVVSGMVGLIGGLGGFLLPIMFGALIDVTGVNSTIFMLLWGITGVSLVWMYWTEIVPARTHRTRVRAVPQPA